MGKKVTTVHFIHTIPTNVKPIFGRSSIWVKPNGFYVDYEISKKENTTLADILLGTLVFGKPSLPFNYVRKLKSSAAYFTARCFLDHLITNTFFPDSLTLFENGSISLTFYNATEYADVIIPTGWLSDFYTASFKIYSNTSRSALFKQEMQDISFERIRRDALTMKHDILEFVKSNYTPSKIFLENFKDG